MNSMSSVAITDLYRRHLAPQRTDAHYVRAAQVMTLASSVVMIVGAWGLFRAQTTTLQHLWTEFQSILAGGLLGLFLLGFLTTRVDARAVGYGLAAAVGFSTLMSLQALDLLPRAWSAAMEARCDSYYTGIVGNLITFGLGCLVAFVRPGPARPLDQLTLWTVNRTKHSDPGSDA